jgi:membrane-bound serine protease (ClpP class)
MWNELVSLFTEMETLVIIFLSLGLILGMIEVFIPGFGIFGIMGIIVTIAGIVLRIVAGASVVQVLMLITLFVLFVLVLFLAFVYSARFGILSKTGIIQGKTSISNDYASDKKNFAHLLGKQGVTQTVCKPVGKVQIDNLSYQVFSNGPYLEKGTYVKVIEVDGANIIVKKNLSKTNCKIRRKL